MTSRVIVSSKSLERYLHKVFGLNPSFDYMTLNLEKRGRLFLNSETEYTDCEIQKSFQCEIPVKRIIMLINFLNVIEEQPITLKFDDSGWIFIEAIL